jgi:DNA-binding transcriptional ArsR family regulator
MPFDPPRELTDPKAMRALAHPVRLALLEALTDAGQLTATEAGERVGESPANASFHLRQLAKYGFVEEAEGGTGRRRPWKLRQLGLRWSDVSEDAERSTAAQGLSRVVTDRYLSRARVALSERNGWTDAWREATGVNQMRLYLTAEEMREINEELVKLLLERHQDRRAPSPDHPAGAERVEILTLAYRLP